MAKFAVPEEKAPFEVTTYGSGKRFVVPENAPPSGPTGPNHG